MARTDTPADKLIDINALAERFGVRVRYIRRLVSERRIPYIKLGKYVRLQRSALDAFIEAGRVPVD